MGRATITGGGTDGLYTVELDLGADRIAGIVSALESSKSDLEARLPDLNQAITDAESEFQNANAALDAAIDGLRDDPETFDMDDVRAAAADVYAAVKKRDTARLEKALIDTNIDSLVSEINRLNAVEVQRTESLWCADYTEDATGEVATIEVPGEPQKTIIVPGARAPASADGQLIARAAQTANQVYFNAAVLPGMQRHIHPWRVGTISNIDTDSNTADVTLDTETSSAQGLQVGDPDALSGVPVNYMTCNASAFEDGDRVVVDMRGPTVVGFESNPRPCQVSLIYRTFPSDSPGAAGFDLISEMEGNENVRFIDFLPYGEDGLSVEARVNNEQKDLGDLGTEPVDWIWFGWSDGITDQTRQDLNVREDVFAKVQAFWHLKEELVRWHEVSRTFIETRLIDGVLRDVFSSDLGVWLEFDRLEISLGLTYDKMDDERRYITSPDPDAVLFTLEWTSIPGGGDSTGPLVSSEWTSEKDSAFSVLRSTHPSIAVDALITDPETGAQVSARRTYFPTTETSSSQTYGDVVDD